ncbi:MAG: hypothetical protein HUU55_14460, partial [Myxococcales bacterium]|nr:hypothetical protein [Myxococcales bacterium]
MKITTPRPRSREIFVIAALALLRMGACSDPVPPTPPEIKTHTAASPPPVPLTVDVFGCVDLRVDGVCMLPSTSRSLCFWIADISSDTKLTIQTTTILPITRQDEFDKGQMRCVDIPEDAASVTVHAGDQYLPKVYQLTTEETCEAVNKAKKRRKESQGNKTAAIADIRRILADHSMISPY